MGLQSVRVLFGMLSAVALWACVPQVNAGYISMVPRKSEAIDLQFNAGSGYHHLAWGAFHFEPYPTANLSLPVGFFGAYPGLYAGRFGVRYRLASLLSLGGGVGGGIAVYDGDTYTSFLLDLELGLGHRWRWFGLSFAFRPTYVLPSVGTVGGELAFAFFVAKHWALTVLMHARIYLWSEGVAWGESAAGGGIGVMGQL